MIILIDNYDSFSYNLYQLIGELQPDIKVVRNDQYTPEKLEEMHPTHLIISPGPGRPADAGICEDAIRYFKGKLPILGVCLGHQAICETFGATISYAKKLMHGKMSVAKLDQECPIFKGIGETTEVARYHSLAAVKETIPDTLKVTAETEDGEIMAVKHTDYDIYGVQFHPESILTPEGRMILKNFWRCKIMIKEAIALLSKREDLDASMVEQVMGEIMTGEATDAQKAAFLTALSMKGETISEITTAAKYLRDHCEHFENDKDVLEIVGTGGDGSNTINISTIASIIVSAGGVTVAKHGNRAASSKCGTADCLEALGVKIDVDADKMKEVMDQIHIGFLFAQKYHPAMRFVGPVRKEMGTRTLFNLLGPLANPARATMQLYGVYSADLVEPLAHVLHNLGVKKGMAVYGMDSMDEISLSAPTKVCEFDGDDFKTYEITPEQFGLKTCQKSDLVGGEPAVNAQIVRDIFEGKETGPKRDVVLLNAGAAFHISKENVSVEQGIEMAREIIDSGKALKQLDAFIKLTNA